MQSSASALILSRPAVITTLVVAFGLVIGSVTLAGFATHEIGSANSRAARAQQTVLLVNQLLTTITDAETAQRGYLLTRDSKYLAPYESALPQYRNDLAALAREFAGDPGRAPTLRRLSSLCDSRFAEITKTIRLRRDSGIAPALNVIESDEGWQTMNRIRSVLRSLQKREVAAVTRHTESATERARVFRNLNVVLLGIATFLGGVVGYRVVRRLHDLEGLIKVCAWTKQVQWQGHWISFEEYLAKRFHLFCTHGISDEAAQRLGREIADTPLPQDVNPP